VCVGGWVGVRSCAMSKTSPLGAGGWSRVAWQLDVERVVGHVSQQILTCSG
jgi:hypothetical protein